MKGLLDREEFRELETRLGRDAQRLTGELPDGLQGRNVLKGLDLPARTGPKRVRGVTLARAAVCGALVTLLLAGAEDRAGLRGAGRFVPTAQPRYEAPVVPAEAAKDIAALLTGTADAPLVEEWTALARDAEDLVEELTKHVAPLANLIQAPE